MVAVAVLEGGGGGGRGGDGAGGGGSCESSGVMAGWARVGRQTGSSSLREKGSRKGEMLAHPAGAVDTGPPRTSRRVDSVRTGVPSRLPGARGLGLALAAAPPRMGSAPHPPGLVGGRHRARRAPPAGGAPCRKDRRALASRRTLANRACRKAPSLSRTWPANPHRASNQAHSATSPVASSTPLLTF